MQKDRRNIKNNFIYILFLLIVLLMSFIILNSTVENSIFTDNNEIYGDYLSFDIYRKVFSQE